MKNKILPVILIGTLMITAVMTGCGADASNEVIIEDTDTKGNTETGANLETGDDTAASGTVIKPLYPMESAEDALADGAYSVSFTADDLVKTDNGYELTAEVYNYDCYEIEDIDNLTEGSRIQVDNEEITVDEVDKDADTGYVTINGGIENGGVELTVEDGVYRTETMDNYPEYYSVGKITLPLAEDVTFEDQANSATGEDSTVAEADELPDAIADSELAFNCNSTVITVRQEQIVQIIRYWVP